MACEHDSRFSGVFDLPKDCGGCLACHAEKLAAENELFRGDKWTDAEIADISQLRSGLKGPVMAGEINTLPDRIRLYIHDLETNADPAGTIQDLAAQRENCEAMTERYRKLAAALQYNEGDRTISPAAELERLQGEVEHLEKLLGMVWDFARDNNLLYRARIDAIMTAIREKP